MGLLLLSSILAQSSVTSLRNVNPDLHLDAEADYELPAYRFIVDHHETHKTLPSLDIVAKDTGIVLPEADADQPVSYYFERVKARGLFNNMGPAFNRLQEAMQNPRRASDAIQEAIDEMYRLKSRFVDAGTGLETSDSLIESVVTQIEARRMQTSSLQGVTTGYNEVDYETGGWQAGDLVVWVARPGRSKSWMLLKQCHAAWTAGWKPLYVSMEMGGVQNMRRLIGIETGINPNYLKRGTIGTMAMPGLNDALDRLLQLRPLHMVTANFSRTVSQIANFIDEYGPDIVYIDAGYLLQPAKKRYGSSGRRESVSDVIEELKQLSADTGIPFVITVQFNRAAEHRRRLGASDVSSFSPIAHLSLAEIGETDVIGQAATHVLGIEYPPEPLQQSRYRTFGFLKGREGESGWWLTDFIPTNFAPVSLDIVPRTDEAYQLVFDHVASQSRGRGNGRPQRDPSQRTHLMTINGRGGNENQS